MDISDLDLNLLVIFDALLRTHSVSATARHLNMSQPATSFALNRLRKAFDDPLFIRTPHGVHPTPYAEGLALPLATILESIRSDILHRSAFDPATAQRAITLNMHDVGELVFLPPILKRIMSIAPGIEVRTVNREMGEIEPALRAGEVDLVIGHFPELHVATLFQQRLFSHSFVCIVRKGHPIAGHEMTRRQFIDGVHGIVHATGQTRDVLSAELEAQGLTRRIALSIQHYLAVPMILSASDLIFTVPYAIGEQLAKLGEIKLLNPPFKEKRRVVKQYWHTRFHQDPANKWMRGVVAELFVQSNQRARPVKRQS